MLPLMLMLKIMLIVKTRLQLSSGTLNIKIRLENEMKNIFISNTFFYLCTCESLASIQNLKFCFLEIFD